MANLSLQLLIADVIVEYLSVSLAKHRKEGKPFDLARELDKYKKKRVKICRSLAKAQKKS